MRTVTTMKNFGKENRMKTFAMLMLTASIAAGALPSTSMAAGKGTSGGQFLRLGAGARGPAMGGAVSPVVDDATAIYWNPAGLADVKKRDLSLSYNAYFEDTAAQFFGYAHPREDRGTWAAGVTMFGVSDIEKRSATAGDADAADLGSFDTRDMALSIGYGNRTGWGEGRLNYGLAVKFISSDLGTEKATTGAVDLGSQYRFREDSPLVLSLAVLNLGGELKFDEEGDPLPLNVKPGLGYRMEAGRMGHLTMALDADILVHDNVAYVQPGLEWEPVHAFALRTGYQFGREEDAGSGFAAGAGFRFFNMGLDYAFVPYGDLGNTHRVSFGVKF